VAINDSQRGWKVSSDERHLIKGGSQTKLNLPVPLKKASRSHYHFHSHSLGRSLCHASLHTHRVTKIICKLYMTFNSI
uniref:Uncharacterized protein n=1 Tax=Macaca fascicularis TaxID=9541 RepID=A0A7N9D9I8_MACFA